MTNVSPPPSSNTNSSIDVAWMSQDCSILRPGGSSRGRGLRAPRGWGRQQGRPQSWPVNSDQRALLLASCRELFCWKRVQNVGFELKIQHCWLVGRCTTRRPMRSRKWNKPIRHSARSNSSFASSILIIAINVLNIFEKKQYIFVLSSSYNR